MKNRFVKCLILSLALAGTLFFCACQMLSKNCRFCGSPIETNEDKYFHLKCCERAIFFGKSQEHYDELLRVFGNEKTEKLEEFANNHLPNFMNLLSNRLKLAESAKKELEEINRDLANEESVLDKQKIREIAGTRFKNAFCDYWSIRLRLIDIYLKNRAGIISAEKLAEIDREEVSFYSRNFKMFEKVPKLPAFVLANVPAGTPKDLSPQINEFARNQLPQMFSLLEKHQQIVEIGEKDLQEISEELRGTGRERGEIYQAATTRLQGARAKYAKLRYRIVDIYWRSRVGEISAEAVAQIDTNEIRIYK